MSHPIDRLSPLFEPARRRVFEFVSASDSPVGRERVAAGTGVSLPLATFHLEKLLEAGLLESSFGSAEGGTRRSRGRPAKLYRARREELTVSIPGRDYRLAAELLAAALPPERQSALDEAARERGRTMGRRVPEAGGLVEVLDAGGYQPRTIEGGAIALRNCPFEALTSGHSDTICPANLALLEGLLEGAGVSGMEARLEPGEGRCCVLLRPVEK